MHYRNLICDRDEDSSVKRRLISIKYTMNFEFEQILPHAAAPRSVGAVRKSLQELIESASPAAVRAEAYLSPGGWERRSRLMTIKVTDFEFKALSSLTEVTGLTKSQIMRLAVKVPRAAPLWNQTTENTPEDDHFVQGELFLDDGYR